MAGHGSPPAEDKANHPARKVGRTQTEINVGRMIAQRMAVAPGDLPTHQSGTPRERELAWHAWND